MRAALAWTRRRATTLGRGLALAALALACAALMIPLVLALVALARFGGRAFTTGDARLLLVLALLIGCVAGARWLAQQTRSLVGLWCDAPIPSPYRTKPLAGGDASLWRRTRLLASWLLTDPATWRDMLWAIVNGACGWLLAGAPALLILFGLVAIPAGVAVPLGLACVAIGLWSAPLALRAYGPFAHYFLAPTRGAELALRVRHLAQTRSDTIDAGAAEMRRLERDLHDGAQARLVAMGMTLDIAGELVDTDPAAARALLAEARDASAKALAELRDLVRGIHPPVLADRGLGEAIRALALECPVRADLAGELSERPPPPVESAAYFAVSELLANVVKHSGATRVWIDIRHHGGALRISVTDDGHGGADAAAGTGLRGIERRLAAFDGVLAVSSPAGGPTVVNMEIPCEL
jgi:signal transduction histidine kinase